MTRLVRGNTKREALVTAILSAPHGVVKLKFGKRMSGETWLIEYDPALDGYSIYQLSVELGLQEAKQPVKKRERTEFKRSTLIAVQMGRRGLILF